MKAETTAKNPLYSCIKIHWSIPALTPAFQMLTHFKNHSIFKVFINITINQIRNIFNYWEAD